MKIVPPPEQLGSFYLGAEYDPQARKIGSRLLHYDSRDLTTHAVCVGMTGSGKTGLCIGLLEEAAIDQVPAILIDPKGDMTNLLLQFEGLAPEDFSPWINADDASRKGLSAAEYAQSTAEKWEKGLAQWGQGKERLQLLRQSVDYTIYTPGSDAGIPINLLGSFAAPKVDFDSEAEQLRERIQGTVAALLGMIDSKADPVRSREGILLANLFEHHWRRGEDLDLTKLILGIQKPPMKQLGVFDVDTFFPEKDRFQLAMDFNSLMASPQFQYWLQGDPLDIDKIYFKADGQPRHSIFYIAHLSDGERMFFVTLLLNSLISWMRRQSGTTSLRSLLYFDEIFGYFPPGAEPPSKRPLLTLLKQARAFGVGTVLVTQNPVDIDYKGLSNAGTWFIGKLQTERDQMRVLDGLEGAVAAAGSSQAPDFGKLIASLSSRVFLMHNVHESEPRLFHTRWAMSYLRGPLTRPQVRTLMREKKQGLVKAAAKASAPSPVTAPTTSTRPPQSVPPSLNPGIEQRFFGIRQAQSYAQRTLGDQGLHLVYEAGTLGSAKVCFVDTKRGIDTHRNIALLAPPPNDLGRTDWEQHRSIENWQNDLLTQVDQAGVPVQFGAVPDSLDTTKEFTKVKKEFSAWLYQSQRFEILEHEDLKLYQGAGESNEAFLMRVRQAAREERDAEVDKLQERFEPKLDRIHDRIRKEERDLEAAKDEVQSRKTAEWVGVAETLFSVFAGRRRSFSGITSKRQMSRKAAQKVEASEEDLVDLEEDLTNLQRELEDKIAEVNQKWESVTQGVAVRAIKPRKVDIIVETVLLAWYPYWVNEGGQRLSAYQASDAE